MDPENQNPVPQVQQTQPTPDIAQAGAPVEQKPTPPLPPVPPIPPEAPKPKSKLLLISVILLAVVGLGSLGYWTYQNYFVPQKPATTIIPASLITPSPVATIEPTPIWKTYISSDKRYTFKYPNNGDWKVNEPSHPFGFWTQVICDKCTGNNLYYLQVTPIVSKTLEEFSSISAGLGLSDNKNIKLGDLDAIQSLQAGSPQAATCKTVFTVFQNQGYQISECFSENLTQITKVEDLPKPNPDIFSTFEFLK